MPPNYVHYELSMRSILWTHLKKNDPQIRRLNHTLFKHTFCDYRENALFPAVTICNMNRLKRSQLVGTHYQPILVIDDTYRHYMDNNFWSRFVNVSILTGGNSNTSNSDDDHEKTSQSGDLTQVGREFTWTDVLPMTKCVTFFNVFSSWLKSCLWDNK